VSYNPNLNLIYVTARVSQTPLVENVKHLDLATGKIINDPETFGGNSAPIGSTITGTLTAMDARTDKIVVAERDAVRHRHRQRLCDHWPGLLFHGGA